MAKYVCQVCGYVYEGDAAPAECPICHAPASKFTKQEEGKTWAAEHVVGVAKGAPFATPTTCSAAQVLPSSCLVNLEAGA